MLKIKLEMQVSKCGIRTLKREITDTNGQDSVVDSHGLLAVNASHHYDQAMEDKAEIIIDPMDNICCH